MAKAIRLYTGHDSQGRMIEAAERDDGVWFYREYGWNGYGVGWTKWTLYDDDPSFRHGCFEWGFGVLRIMPGPHKLRLPDPKPCKIALAGIHR